MRLAPQNRPLLEEIARPEDFRRAAGGSRSRRVLRRALRAGPVEDGAALVARRFVKVLMVTSASASFVQRLEPEHGALISSVNMPENYYLSISGRLWPLAENQKCS